MMQPPPWIRRLLLPALPLALLACSLMPAHRAAGAFSPLAPATLGATRTTLQVLHGAIGERDVVFQCMVAVSPEEVTLVGLSALGQRWFSLRYDGITLDATTSLQAPELLDPQRVLTDLQLAMWPLAALQQALAGSAWQVGEPTPATRRLRRGGSLIAEVHYASANPWQGRFWLSNFELGYTLAVESQPLP